MLEEGQHSLDTLPKLPNIQKWLEGLRRAVASARSALQAALDGRPRPRRTRNRQANATASIIMGARHGAVMLYSF